MNNATNNTGTTICPLPFVRGAFYAADGGRAAAIRAIETATA